MKNFLIVYVITLTIIILSPFFMWEGYGIPDTLWGYVLNINWGVILVCGLFSLPITVASIILRQTAEFLYYVCIKHEEERQTAGFFILQIAIAVALAVLWMKNYLLLATGA